MFQEWR